MKQGKKMSEPTSMDKLVYFTRRAIGNGNIMAWVYRKKCPKCGKALMSKPIDKKGTVKIRANEYVCPECGHTVEKKAYEETLTCEIKYACPYCGNEGKTDIPFKRKKYKGVDSLVFKCQKCGKEIAITKKMKKEKED